MRVANRACHRQSRLTLNPTHQIGAYEIASLIAGGTGEVFRARDTRLNRDLAVRVLPKDFAAAPDRLRRFEQEAKTLAVLNHPNVRRNIMMSPRKGSDGERFRENLKANQPLVRREPHSGNVTAREILYAAGEPEKGIYELENFFR